MAKPPSGETFVAKPPSGETYAVKPVAKPLWRNLLAPPIQLNVHLTSRILKRGGPGRPPTRDIQRGGLKTCIGWFQSLLICNLIINSICPTGVQVCDQSMVVGIYAKIRNRTARHIATQESVSLVNFYPIIKLNISAPNSPIETIEASKDSQDHQV